MDPNQEEDLKKLSLRTEELLSRLNDLSNSLSVQIKNNQSPHVAASENKVALPPNAPEKSYNSSEQIIQRPPIEFAAEQRPLFESNYYSLPINTHYLEKREKSIKTTGSGQQFLTTSSTSIFTEVQNKQPEAEAFIPVEQPTHHHKPPETPIIPSQTQAYYAPTIPNTPPPPRTETQIPNFPPNTSSLKAEQIPLQPSAVFSVDQSPTRRANPQGRTQEIADQIAAHNKEIKDRLQKYSNRVQISSKGDVLRLFALAAPLFALGAAIGIVNALEITEFSQIIAIYCIGLFLGIFLSAIALRIVEISELVRWAHNQILFMQSKLDEEKNKS